jgi:heme/copper-type cytochrome/quinol oxidase subunit 2
MGISLRHAVLLIVPVVAFSIIQPALAQESENIIINRVEIWGLFYKGMVVAFTIGAIIMGVIAYVVFRFRESNPRNIPRSQPEGQH